MTSTRNKLRSLARLVALRQRLKEQTELALKQARMQTTLTETLLAAPWVLNDSPIVAADLIRAQALRDVGYAHLEQQKADVARQQEELSSRHQAFRQVEGLLERAQKQAAARLAKEEARNTDDWLRRKRGDAPE